MVHPWVIIDLLPTGQGGPRPPASLVIDRTGAIHTTGRPPTGRVDLFVNAEFGSDDEQLPALLDLADRQRWRWRLLAVDGPDSWRTALPLCGTAAPHGVAVCFLGDRPGRLLDCWQPTLHPLRDALQAYLARPGHAPDSHRQACAMLQQQPAGTWTLHHHHWPDLGLLEQDRLLLRCGHNHDRSDLDRLLIAQQQMTEGGIEPQTLSAAAFDTLVGDLLRTELPWLIDRTPSI